MAAETPQARGARERRERIAGMEEALATANRELEEARAQLASAGQMKGAPEVVAKNVDWGTPASELRHEATRLRTAADGLDSAADALEDQVIASALS